jgi:hypothetical protein
MSDLLGGKFGHGFVSAGVGSIMGGNSLKIKNDFGRYATVALVGGTVSKMTGGKFANGAMTATLAAIVSNHLRKAAIKESTPSRRGADVPYDDPVLRTKDAARTLLERSSDGNEHAAALYTDGEKYYFTEPVTDGLTHEVRVPRHPDGFTLEGIIHNHPGENFWPSVGSGLFDLDTGRANLLQVPVWTVGTDAHLYRYVPQPLPLDGPANGQFQSSRYDPNRPGGIPGFNGRVDR